MCKKILLCSLSVMLIIEGKKTFIFDAYGTLFDISAPFIKYQYKLGDKTDNLANLFRLKQIEYTWLLSLMGKYLNFWDITEKALTYAYEYNNIDDKTLKKRLLDECLKVQTFPDVKEILLHLKNRGFSVFILSNGTYEMIKFACHSNDMNDLIDKIISVDEVKIYKPHPNAYKLALEHLKTENIVFLSSNSWDISGAINFGFKTIWVNRKSDKWNNLTEKPFAEINNLNELKEI